MAAYTFLGLVNEQCNKFNEVELTASTFPTAAGVYADFKNAVNKTLNRIGQDPTRWPFTHVTQDLTLTPLQVRYNYPSGVKLIDFNTFRVQGSDTLNNTTGKLYPIEYEHYLDYYSDFEYRSDHYEDVPKNVVRTEGRDFLIIPPARSAYVVSYDSHIQVPSLVNHDDVPIFPEDFKWAIFDGALIYSYHFRGDIELSQAQEKVFDDSLKLLRIAYNNRTNRIRSPMLVR